MRYTNDAKCPLVATPGSVGSDLFSTLNYKFLQMQTRLIQTDPGISLPPGTFGLISGRSGLALKGLHVHVGIIDRGPVGVIMTDLSGSEFQIKKGDRIGQIRICRYEKPKWCEIQKMDSTQRKGGFGSTGK